MSCPSRKELQQVAVALQKLSEVQQGDKKQLIGNTDYKIIAVVSCHRTLTTTYKTLTIPLAHSVWGHDSDICFFGRDFSKDLDEAQDILADKMKQDGVDFVTPITYQRVCKEFARTYPGRQNLSRSFEVFLADQKLIPQLSKTLGSHFRKSSKRPIPVQFRRDHLKEDIEKALKKSLLVFTKKGVVSEGFIGSHRLNVDENVNNMETFIKNIDKKIGLQHIKSICLHLAPPFPVTSFPIYQNTEKPKASTLTAAQLGNVEINTQEEEEEEGEEQQQEGEEEDDEEQQQEEEPQEAPARPAKRQKTK